MRKQPYPGWRTMTGSQRYNARKDRIFDEARRLEAEKRAKQDLGFVDIDTAYEDQCADICGR